MTHTDLKEAAMKATPGPWHENKNAVNDIAYVVIANPARILALLDEIDRLREALESVCSAVESSGTLTDRWVRTLNAAISARAALKEKLDD